MTPAEQRIRDKAIEYARRQKKAIARKLTDKNQFPPNAEPVSIFMAGSPGAGKTEASKALVRQFRDPPVRIDPDELRSEFKQYFTARSVVNQLKREFGRSIYLDLILKNHDNSDRIYKDNIDKVDHHVPEKYTAGEVKALTGG